MQEREYRHDNVTKINHFSIEFENYNMVDGDNMGKQIHSFKDYYNSIEKCGTIYNKSHIISILLNNSHLLGLVLQMFLGIMLIHWISQQSTILLGLRKETDSFLKVLTLIKTELTWLNKIIALEAPIPSYRPRVGWSDALL